jgi:hypothetical protein
LPEDLHSIVPPAAAGFKPIAQTQHSFAQNWLAGTEKPVTLMEDGGIIRLAADGASAGVRPLNAFHCSPDPQSTQCRDPLK